MSYAIVYTCPNSITGDVTEWLALARLPDSNFPFTYEFLQIIWHEIAFNNDLKQVIAW